MKKTYVHIDLAPDVQAFRDRFIAATEIEGTPGGIITFYKMGGRYFARSKSSLTGKRVKKDKKFKRTMHNAGMLTKASEIVSPIYNALTEDWRCHDLYLKLIGIGVRLLHAGKTVEDITHTIEQELFNLGYRTEWPDQELPPHLTQWLREEKNLPAKKHTARGTANRQQQAYNSTGQYMWVVDSDGRLVKAANPLYNMAAAPT